MERNLTGTIVKEKALSGSINKGIGMGELPTATGLSEFPMAAYSVNGVDLRRVGDAIGEKSGVEAPVWPEGFAQAVEGMEIPKFYYSPEGRLYMEKMELDIKANQGIVFNFLYSYCDKMVEFVTTGEEIPGGMASMLQGCTSLKRAVLSNFTALGLRNFRYDAALTEVQVGSIGFPVTEISVENFSATNDALVATIYVADDASLPLANSPWGNRNATVIYRSAVTGEVIEV